MSPRSLKVRRRFLTTTLSNQRMRVNFPHTAGWSPDSDLFLFSPSTWISWGLARSHLKICQTVTGSLPRRSRLLKESKPEAACGWGTVGCLTRHEQPQTTLLPASRRRGEAMPEAKERTKERKRNRQTRSTLHGGSLSRGFTLSAKNEHNLSL